MCSELHLGKYQTPVPSQTSVYISITCEIFANWRPVCKLQSACVLRQLTGVHLDDAIRDD